MKLILGILLALIIPIAGTILTDAPVIWPISVLIYNIGLLYSFTWVHQKVVRGIIYSIFATTLFLIEASFFFSYYLQNKGFNDAFFYHLRPDLLYAGVDEYRPVILMIIACLIIFEIMSSSYLAKETSKRGWNHYLALVLFIFGLFISPPAKALVHHVVNISASNRGHDPFENFPELQAQQITPAFSKVKRPNIVLIYAESLNQSYFDETIFPGLLPNLKRLREQSIDFSNVSQGVGASWTIGGIVASQCGYPLTDPLKIDKIYLGMFNEFFLPKATCLGDILKKDGYTLTFIGGADSRFAGKGDFFHMHGYTEVVGRDDLLETLTDQNYYNKWGAFDDTLFDFAIQKFNALSREKFPFLLTLLTLDAHDGYLSKSCATYGENNNRSLDAFHCSDLLISRFVEQVRNSPYSDNTIIIVLSDHLEQIKQEASDRLTFFVNRPAGEKAENSNMGLHYDVAPTILDLIGYTINGQIGFGSSLVIGPGYLPGKFGEKDWQKHAADLTAIGKTLWNNEAISLDEKGIKFTAADHSLSLGGRKFDLPRGWNKGVAYPRQTIFIFDEKSLELEEIKTSTYKLSLTPVTLGKELLENKEKLVLVFSLARYLPWFYDPQRVGLDQGVFFIGKPGGESFSWSPITGDFMIPFDMINELSQSKLSNKIVFERENLLNALERMSTARMEK